MSKSKKGLDPLHHTKGHGLVDKTAIYMYNGYINNLKNSILKILMGRVGYKLF